MNATMTRKSILTAIADAYYSIAIQEQGSSEFGIWEIINENELAEEMSNSQDDPCSPASSSDGNTEDFEKDYCWFLS